MVARRPEAVRADGGAGAARCQRSHLYSILGAPMQLSHRTDTLELGADIERLVVLGDPHGGPLSRASEDVDVVFIGHSHGPRIYTLSERRTRTLHLVSLTTPR